MDLKLAREEELHAASQAPLFTSNYKVSLHKTSWSISQLTSLCISSGKKTKNILTSSNQRNLAAHCRCLARDMLYQLAPCGKSLTIMKKQPSLCRNKLPYKLVNEESRSTNWITWPAVHSRQGTQKAYHAVFTNASFLLHSRLTIRWIGYNPLFTLWHMKQMKTCWFVLLLVR